MEFVNANTWIAEVPLDQSAEASIHYKFVVFDTQGHEPIRENVVSRHLQLPTHGRIKIDCSWNDD
jgi:hypothetical protein